MTRIYLVTEGVHDVAFLSRILRQVFGCKQAETPAELDQGFQRWITSSFKWPHNGKIHRASVPAPEIYIRHDMEVAVVNAEGITEIGKKIYTDLVYFANSGDSLDALGIVLDADKDVSPASREQEMSAVLEEKLAEAVLATRPRTGVFVLPDHQNPGTLEDVLIPLGRRVYGALFAAADQYLTNVTGVLGSLSRDERKEFGKPSGQKKALLSAVAAVLKPGKAIQTTIKDHRWISPETLSAPELAPVLAFLRQLLSPPPPATATPEGEPSPKASG